MGVLERLGQAGAPPGDGAVVRPARERRPARATRRPALGGLEPLERLDEPGPERCPRLARSRRAPVPASSGRNRACRAGAGRSPGRSGASGPARCACAGAGRGSAARASPRRRHLQRPRADRPARAPARGRPGRTPRGPAPRPGRSRRWSGRPRGRRRHARPSRSPASRLAACVEPEPTSPWMSSTRRSAAATSGNRPKNSAGSGCSPSSSRRQNSS